ncbi:MAG: Rieske 2Fe-2S domain-containing protein, partial [Polyangiales bacterium]
MMNGAIWAPLQALSGRRGPKNRNHWVESAREASYPPPYPEGWYVVGRSTEIRARPTFVQCVGNQWVIFRDASGTARVVDAYCPHLGANLADGKVQGDCVECPFHGWKIRGDGCVVGQANGEHPDPRHRTRSWAVEELHGWVLVYHRHGASADGPAPEPPYRLRRVPEIDDGDLIWRGEHDAGLVQMHLLEFLENSAD